MFEHLPQWAPWVVGWVGLSLVALFVVSTLRALGLVDEKRAKWIAVGIAALSIVGPLVALFVFALRAPKLDESDDEPEHTDTQGVSYDSSVEDILEDVEPDTVDSDSDVDLSSDDPADWRL